jgi:hypothetical protein
MSALQACAGKLKTGRESSRLGPSRHFEGGRAVKPAIGRNAALPRLAFVWLSANHFFLSLAFGWTAGSVNQVLPRLELPGGFW